MGGGGQPVKLVSDYAIPVIISGILLGGLCSGVPVFECFMRGARNSIGVVLRILPSLIALIVSVGIFRASGALDMVSLALDPLARLFSLPREAIPLALLRPISGSGAMVIFQDILASFGPDSTIGRIASVMMGSTETTFYTIAVYYGATSVHRTRHTMAASVTADLVGFVMSALAVGWFFGAA